ncbi:MAG: RagB/SusD family nutrient uptake outer membrane protein [Bacteroidales bacterium]
MKIIKISIVLVGLTLFSLSCQKFLDEKSYNADYTYYNTASGLEALVTASYQQTRWCVNSETQYPFEDMGTDLFSLGGDGSHRDAFGQFLSTGMTPQYGLLQSFWDNNYKGIASCNLGLQTLASNTDMAASLKAIHKGEMLFLRAYYYYELVIQFGNIPLQTTPINSVKTDFARVPQKKIWAQIISDARQAWALLPWADAGGKVNGDFGRAGKGAAGHLLAKAYMFRYCDKYTKSQTDANMNEDRGGLTTDIDSVIYFASQVCNYGSGAGSGSNHALASDYATLWGWNPKTGLIAEYMGPEIVFSINNSTTYFYNNAAATDVNTNGNQLHLYYTGQFENYTLSTKLESGTSVAWGNNVGVARNLITGRPWRRVAPTKWYYSDNGLYAAKDYATGKLGKLIDSRLYKTGVWVFFCNGTPDAKWAAYSNGAGSFDPASIGMTAGAQRYAVGDTAILLSLDNVDTRFATGTHYEKLALARAKEKYWYIPMQSIIWPVTRADVSGYDRATNQFPPFAKFLDSRRAATNDQGGYRNFYRMRLAETYILLSEAYARKADFANAAATLNKVRDRAAWKAGELKDCQYWKYDGGTYATATASTVTDMEVTAAFLGGFSDTQLTDFYCDEMGHETAGELNRFDMLVRYGADYWYNRVKADDYWVSNDNGVSNGNIHLYHRFRPIPQTYIDAVNPPDPNPQNYGYY